MSDASAAGPRLQRRCLQAPVRFDRQLVLMVPGGAEESYATQLYELVDGRAERACSSRAGYQFIKLR